MKCPTRFICFIHIPKTAGTSIRKTLECSVQKGGTGTYTYKDFQPLLKLPNPPPTAYIGGKNEHEYGSNLYRLYVKKTLKFIGASYTNPWPGWAHTNTTKYWMKLTPDVMQQLGITQYEDIPILSVVRNPFDRLRSIFNFWIATPRPTGLLLKANEKSLYNTIDLKSANGRGLAREGIYPTYFTPNVTFKDFILSFEHTFYRNDVMFGQCFDHLSIEGKLLTTDILKFENLENDFKSFLKKYNIPSVKLIHEDPAITDPGSLNTKRIPLSKKELVYDREMIKIVEKLFAKDLEHFGYEFDN